MLAMKDGLKPSRFFFSLEKWFPTSFPEMLSRADKYVNAEEAMASKRESNTSQADRGGKRRRDEPNEQDQPIQPWGLFQPQFEAYTPLTVP